LEAVLFNTMQLRVLKPDAPYRGEPMKAEQWAEVSARFSGGLRLATFQPGGIRMRAVLLNDVPNESRLTPNEWGEAKIE
jgi:hypothetical protein